MVFIAHCIMISLLVVLCRGGLFCLVLLKLFFCLPDVARRRVDARWLEVLGGTTETALIVQPPETPLQYQPSTLNGWHSIDKPFIPVSKMKTKILLSCTNWTTIFWYNIDVFIKAFIDLKVPQWLNELYTAYSILSKVIVFGSYNQKYWQILYLRIFETFKTCSKILLYLRLY